MIVEVLNNAKIPSYMNDRFYEKAVKVYHGSADFNIDRVQLSMCCAPGENFGSVIYRLKILYTYNGENQEPLWIIVKEEMEDNPEMQELFDLMKTHVKEYISLVDIVPALETYLGGIKLGPKFYFTPKGSYKVTVFEDLKVLGYKNADRIEGLDEAHARLTLDKLGKFHAASIVLHDKEPATMEPFHMGFFSEESLKLKEYKGVFPYSIKHLSKLAATWPGYEEFAEKLGAFADDFTRRCLELVRPKPNEIKVFNHGDAWTNNIMYKYDNACPNRPIDAIFVDFQLPFYASLGVDVNYFLYSSVNLDVFKTKRDELVGVYYGSFAESLRQMEYPDIPSERDVRKEILSKELYGLITASCTLPLVSIDATKCEEVSLSALGDDIKGPKIREVMFGSERYLKTIKYYLKRFEALQVLD